MNTSLSQRFTNIGGMIGRTPLLEIHYTYKGRPGRIFAKAEYMNLSGSIKDRVALHILKKAYENGSIDSQSVIAEATSGNTGISFSAVGRYLGHKVVIYMPDWMSAERIRLMKSFGAEVRLVSREQGGFLGSIALTEELAKQGNVFLPCQFSNEDNTEAHFLSTGEEISYQLKKLGLTADGVVAGVGTGGTVMGIGRRLRADNPKCGVFPLEPLNSPTLSTGCKVGAHRIQGISDEFIPPIFKREQATDIVSVDDIDSIIMSQMLARRFGLGVGISSGANFLGCILAAEKLGSDSVITTVFADDNKKYLSTDYSDEHIIKEGYLTKDIILTDLIAHRYE
ncbi:MAG: PLP-dependent cysteine synthase family protein [Huintestinicola sp.]